MGAALAKQGRVAEAIQPYAEALRQQPRHVKAYYNLAMLLANQGRLAEGLRLDPTHAAARQFLESSASPGSR